MRRPWLPIVLIFLATIIGIAAVFAIWAKRQLLETQTWSQTSEKLIENEDIQSAVADFITTEIYDNVDVAKVLADRLPPELAPLAGPAAGALRNVTDDVALKVLEQPRVQQLWVQANETAHTKLVALIDDRGEFVSTTGGVVTLDLKGILESITTQLGVGSNLVAKLPADAASVEILKSSELEGAQKGVSALRTAAWVLAALALLLFALAIYLARDRRREALRSVGIGFAVAGIVVLLARGFAGDAVVNSLSQTPSTDAAVRATFSIGTSLLVESGQALIVEGLLIVFAAWLAGPNAWATSIRRSMTPYLRQPRLAYGGLAVLLLLLFWWDPIISTHRFGPSLLLIAFFLIGTEILRRQVIREFPDLVTTRSPAGVAQGLAERMRAARERRVAAASPSAVPGEQRLAALERLGRLRDSNVLDDDEFEAEKTKILSG